MKPLTSPKSRWVASRPRASAASSSLPSSWWRRSSTARTAAARSSQPSWPVAASSRRWASSTTSAAYGVSTWPWRSASARSRAWLVITRSASAAARRAATMKQRASASGAGAAEAVAGVRLHPLPERLLGAGESQLATVAALGLGEPAEQLELEAEDLQAQAVAAVVGGGEEALPATQREVVLPSLEDRVVDPGAEQPGDGGQLAVGELLLEVDGVGRDHRAPAGAPRPEGERHQVGERLARARPRLDEEAAGALQGLGDGARHLQLRLAVLVSLRAGERSGGAEQLDRRRRQGPPGAAATASRSTAGRRPRLRAEPTSQATSAEPSPPTTSTRKSRSGPRMGATSSRIVASSRTGSASAISTRWVKSRRVASASLSARCGRRCSMPSAALSSGRLWLGASGSRIRASSSVSSTVRPPKAPGTRAAQKARSKAAPWATSRAPSQNSASWAAPSTPEGAPQTSASPSPVSRCTASGTGTPGSTMRSSRSTTRRSRPKRTPAISMIRSLRGDSPVVSRSKATKSAAGTVARLYVRVVGHPCG